MAKLPSKHYKIASTDWVSYTPTFGPGFGTVTAVTFKYRRVGDSMQIAGTGTAGTTAHSACTFTLPGGFAMDPAKLDTSAGMVGMATNNSVTTSNARNLSTLAVIGGSTTTVSMTNVADGSASNNFLAILGDNVIAPGTKFSVNCLVPIAGWTGHDFQAANA